MFTLHRNCKLAAVAAPDFWEKRKVLVEWFVAQLGSSGRVPKVKNHHVDIYCAGLELTNRVYIPGLREIRGELLAQKVLPSFSNRWVISEVLGRQGVEI